MSKPPPIPPEQRAFKGQKPDLDDGQAELAGKQPGNADVNLDEQGSSGNLRQNTSRSGNIQDR
ncbi:hypothetical protein [Caulobacter segnis]